MNRVRGAVGVSKKLCYHFMSLSAGVCVFKPSVDSLNNPLHKFTLATIVSSFQVWVSDVHLIYTTIYLNCISNIQWQNVRKIYFNIWNFYLPNQIRSTNQSLEWNLPKSRIKKTGNDVLERVPYLITLCKGQ